MDKLPINKVLNGDCIAVMKRFPAKKIDMVMFSPPYWGQRDYEVKGQIGLEPDPTVYFEKMLEVCAQVKRILKTAGSFYLNMGDKYCGSGFGSAESWLKPKQLLLMPSRLAIKLQENGWILRNDIIWHKPNHMPSSARDRLTNSYEHIFHFVKNQKYYYDLDSIRKPHRTKPTQSDPPGKKSGAGRGYKNKPGCPFPAQRWLDQYHGKDVSYHPKGRNPTDFWSLPIKPFLGSHFGVYPETICINPIKSSCPVNGIVLDPMCGIGTTLIVAHKLGRRWIGIELKKEYVEMAEKELEKIGAFSKQLADFLGIQPKGKPDLRNSD